MPYMSQHIITMQCRVVTVNAMHTDILELLNSSNIQLQYTEILLHKNQAACFISHVSKSAQHLYINKAMYVLLMHWVYILNMLNPDHSILRWLIFIALVL